jgi:2'-5' RNA ligase
MRIKKQERRTDIYEQEFKQELLVHEYVLYRSRLTPAGPEYEKVYVFKALE